jgi:hypothetical protein
MQGKDLEGEHIALNVRVPASDESILRAAASVRKVSKSDIAREAIAIGAAKIAATLTREAARAEKKRGMLPVPPIKRRGRKAAGQ